MPVNSGGASVKAVALVLNDSISAEDAASLLWRREIGEIGRGRSYTRPAVPRANQVLVDSLTDHEGFATIFYTDFPEPGKLTNRPKVTSRLWFVYDSRPSVPTRPSGRAT